MKLIGTVSIKVGTDTKTNTVTDDLGPEVNAQIAQHAASQLAATLVNKIGLYQNGVFAGLTISVE